MSHVYDSDDGGRSPGLEPSKPDYALVDEQPPPFVRNDKGTSPDSSRKSQLNHSEPGFSHGSAVLIGQLDGNRPDIRDYEIHNPFKREITPEEGFNPQKIIAKNALQLLQNEPPAPKDIAPKYDFHQQDNQIRDTKNEQGIPPQLPPPVPSIVGPTRTPLELKAYSMLQPSEAPRHDLLPAIHQPPSALPKSPENQPSLPPLQSALGELPSVPAKEPRVNASGAPSYSLHPVTNGPPPRVDVPREHQLPGPSQVPLSPYSHWSPASSKDISTVPSPVSHPPCPRPPPHKFNIHYVTSPYDVPTHTAKSPVTCYPTPTDPPTVGSYDRPYGDANTPLNGVPTGSFKCHHPGCNALPFQTQYLLNSHANVHSQDRPHYCPVEGCVRGPGGKGFKRKNEMIRHGLVHNSPGYICPFCPDQQRKYPRPDNLQRHVRVHHVDKDKDDPELRRVLMQRPEGSGRGRRRRAHN